MVRIRNEMKNTSAGWFSNQVRTIIEALFRLADGDKTFYDTRDYPWIQDFEKHYPQIRSELDTILSQPQFTPSWESISNDPNVRVGDSWRVFIFKAYKNRSARNCNLCPQTAALIDKYPEITTAWFSILAPHKNIPEHRGPYNGVLRYHLALQIPQDPTTCGIRVGQDIRQWEAGKSLLFDDTHLHEVWNNSDEVRVVLFIDVLRKLPFPLNLLNRMIVNLISYSDMPKHVVKNIS